MPAKEKLTDSNLISTAINMVANAEQGILVNQEGRIIKDFRNDLDRMQKVFDNIERHRVNAYVKGTAKKGGTDIRISANDIKAVLFKPFIELPIENPNVVQGRTHFTTIWNFTKRTIYDDLSTVTETDLDNAFQDVKDGLRSFERYVLSYLTSTEKDFDKFINALLDEIPTAFGDISPN